ADHRVGYARLDEPGREIDSLLRGAALAVDRRAGSLDRKALLKPRVARHVQALLAELRHAARHHVLDHRGLDPRALDDLAVAAPEQLVGVGVLVVALLPVAAPDRRAHSLHDHDLAALSL